MYLNEVPSNQQFQLVTHLQLMLRKTQFHVLYLKSRKYSELNSVEEASKQNLNHKRPVFSVVF